MPGTLIELVTLALRCSPVERAREILSPRLALLHPKKSPWSTDPPAVCIIAENEVWGGTEEHTRQLVRWLLAQGLHVKYVTAGKHCGDAELTSVYTPSLEWIDLPLSVEEVGSRRAWVRALRQIKAHAVILPCPRTDFGSFAFLGALRRSFRRIVYVEHSTPTSLPEGFITPGWSELFSRRRRRDWIESLRRRYRVRCADRVIAVSPNVASALRDAWFVPAKKLSIVLNGVEADGALPTATERNQARSALGISPESFVFGMVTRLSHEKGVDLAVRAFAMFVQTYADRAALLLIAGEGPEEMALRKLADELGIADRIRWLGFEKQPQRIYRVMDAILVPSRAEGLPLALLEAMACGVIPITSDVGGMPEVVANASLGWVVPAEQLGALSDAMLAAAMLGSDARDAMRRSVQSHVRERYDRTRSLDQLYREAGLADASSWNRTYALGKLRDMGNAWLELLKLWVATHRPEMSPGRPAAPEPQTMGKPTVCLLEESHGWGGAENHTFMLIQHLLQHGYPVEYVCGRDSVTQPPSGTAASLRAPISIFEDNQEAEAGWRSTFGQLKSRVLVVPALDVQYGMSHALTRAMRQNFDRIIYIEHTLPPPMPPKSHKRHLGGLIPGLSIWWHRERLRRKLRMRGPTHVIAVSDSVRQQFIDTWACPPGKIETVRNGVDCRRFDLTASQRSAAREASGLPANALVFGMMARLSHEKGVDLALSAFAAFRILEPECDAYLVIGGSGPEEAALAALSDELGITERVRWAGFTKDTPQLYAQMDVLLATSRVEGLPLALLEAMAAGVIPIVFRVGGMPEVLNDPALGWVVEAGDVSGVAQAMREVTRLPPQQVEAYRGRVRQQVRGNFNLELTNGRITEIIEHG